MQLFDVKFLTEPGIHALIIEMVVYLFQGKAFEQFVNHGMIGQGSSNEFEVTVPQYKVLMIESLPDASAFLEHKVVSLKEEELDMHVKAILLCDSLDILL